MIDWRRTPGSPVLTDEICPKRVRETKRGPVLAGKPHVPSKAGPCIYRCGYTPTEPPESCTSPVSCRCVIRRGSWHAALDPRTCEFCTTRHGSAAEMPVPGKSKRDRRPIEERLAEGHRLAREGIRRADEAAREDWKDVVDYAIHTVAINLAEFTADDVWDLLDEWGVPHPRALGFDARAYSRRITAARNRGWCEIIKDRPDVHTRRPDQHGSKMPTDRSLIHNPDPSWNVQTRMI